MIITSTRVASNTFRRLISEVPRLSTARSSFSATFVVLLMFATLPGMMSAFGRVITPQDDAGGLDATFGNGGKVLTDFGANSSAVDALIQPDGKVVLAGGIAIGFPNGSVVARYNTDGSLDTTFGTMGVTIITATFNVSSIALQQDGKLVLAGGSASYVNGSRSFPGNFALVRLNADGSFDSSFGVGGFVSGTTPDAASVAIQADGKIIAAGVASRSGPSFLGVFRYNSDGVLDSSFGTGGEVIGPEMYVSALKVQADARIVAAGIVPTGGRPVVVRLNPDGSKDSTFGSGGIAEIANESADVNGLNIQVDGKILLAGTAIYRLNVDGSLDQSFGSGGVVANDLLGDLAYSAAVQDDGRIVVAGARFTAVGGPDPVVVPFLELSRYNQDGSFDTTFGSGGTVITGFSTEANSAGSASSVTLQPDGKIVAAGWAGSFSKTEFALARYEPGPPASDFSVRFSQPSIAVDRGTKIQVQVSINRTGGFSGPVTVRVPHPASSGIVVRGERTVSTDGSTATFEFKVKHRAAAGSNYLTFTGTDASGRVRTATETLVVR